MIFASGINNKYTPKEVKVKGKDLSNDVRTYCNTKGEVVTMQGPTKASISGSLDMTDVLPEVRHLVNQLWTPSVVKQDPKDHLEFLDRLSDLLEESTPRNWQRKHHTHHSWATKEVVLTLLLVAQRMAMHAATSSQSGDPHTAVQLPRLPLPLLPKEIWLFKWYRQHTHYQKLQQQKMWQAQMQQQQQQQRQRQSATQGV